jgi:ElaB/YqjD/DUF883 family membrane-anchored ribosome-binding protein
MSTGSRIEAESHKDPATLEREIDQQRDSINDLVNALENKLSPGQLLDQALSYTKGHGGEFASNLGNTVKANPIPTLLTTVGLAWMMMGQRQPTSSTTTSHTSLNLHDKADSAKQAAAGVRDKANQMQHDLRDKVNDARQRVGDSSQQAGAAIRQQSDRARAGFQNLLEEQPLVLGALGIAVGALLGASVPRTRQEDQLMGSASDQLMDKAKAKAREGYEKVAETGGNLAHELNERVKNSESSDGSDSERSPVTQRSTTNPAPSTNL